MHVNGHTVSHDYLVPMTVEADAQVDYPAGDTYSGEVRIPLTFRSAPAPVKLRYQACTETECMLPVEVTLTPESAG
jgi:hypothetical protein